MKYLILVMVLLMAFSSVEAKRGKRNNRKVKKLGKVSTKLINNIEAYNTKVNLKKPAYNPEQHIVKIDRTSDL